MPEYIHQLADWPAFRWDREALADRLAVVRHAQGRIRGRMEALGFQLQQEAVLKTLTSDVVKTSEIEGEHLDSEQVRSSIARRLGIDIGGVTYVERHIDGVVEMMLDATRQYDRPLTPERLFTWHASLFPTARTGITRISVGNWRDDSTGPMEVVSGLPGREHVHFEAPAAFRLQQETAAFLGWFNAPSETDQVLKAGVAHLWFVTIHPFADGNGRIARAIADMTLARSDSTPQRFYSMSTQIRQERADYYEILERAQRAGTLDVTPWMEWFLNCLERAIERARATLASILAKAQFWERIAGIPINDRQRLMLNLLLDGFEGKLTTSKWATIAKCSQDTALRDILDLVARGILVRSPEGGRNTAYALADNP
jgi:Fic family protein